LFSLKEVNLVSCTLDSNVPSLFLGTYQLKQVTLPDGLNVTNASNMFSNSAVQQINNLENLGSRTVDVDFTNFSALSSGYPAPQNKIIISTQEFQK
jgi:hypothetical protein